jgi:hypothetical protein
MDCVEFIENMERWANTGILPRIPDDFTLADCFLGEEFEDYNQQYAPVGER